ncbi:hypothetical protein PsorP6_000634 [Peronosclerospora sorghi]|uniref:Uncharacterized protein n=1 Tax=Peronosclerospora sorghi TaxID=230839 RepID=A0ACC0WQ55_9STRA|nr:hypothetical protein PsorP6_000634 [Peronosclerospora sorghi]
MENPGGNSKRIVAGKLVEEVDKSKDQKQIFINPRLNFIDLGPTRSIKNRNQTLKSEQGQEQLSIDASPYQANDLADFVSQKI